MCLCPSKTAEHTEVVFGLKTFGDPRNIVMDRGLDFGMVMRTFRGVRNVAHSSMYIMGEEDDSMRPSLNYFG